MEEMEYERIEELIDEGYKPYDVDAPNVDGLLEGLKIFREVSSEYIEYACEHDLFHGAGQSDLKGITEDQIRMLGEFGWHFNTDGECFCKFV